MSRTLALAPRRSRHDAYAQHDVERQTNMNMPPPPQAYWRPHNSTSTMQVEPFQSPPSLLYRRSLVEDPAFSRNSSSNPDCWAPQGAIDPDFLRGSYVVPFPGGVISPPLGAQHSPESKPSSFASSSASLEMRPLPPMSVEDEPPSAGLAYLDRDESPPSSPEHTHIILPSLAAREKMREAELAMGAKEREVYGFARNRSVLQRAPSSGKRRNLPAPPSQGIEECPPYEESVSPGTGSTMLAGHPVNRLVRSEKGALLVLSYHAPPPPSPSPEPPSMPLRKPDHRRIQVQEPEPTPDQPSSSNGKRARKPAVARRHSSKPPPRDLDSIDELDESNPYNINVHHRGPYDAIACGSSRDPRAGKATKAHRPTPTVDSPLKLNLKPGQVLSGSIFQPPSQRQPMFSQPLNIFAGPPLQPAHASRPHPHFASPPHESPYQHAHSLSTPHGSHSPLHAISAPAPQPAPPMPYLDPALFPNLNSAIAMPPAPGGSSTSLASLPTASSSLSSFNPNSGSSPNLPSSHSNSIASVPSSSSMSNPNTHSVNATFPPIRRTSIQSHSYTSSPNGSQASLAESVGSTKRGAHSRPPVFAGAKRPESYHAGQVPAQDSFYAQLWQAHDSFFGPQTLSQLSVGLAHTRGDSSPSVVQRERSYQEYQHPPQPQLPMPTTIQGQPLRDRVSMPPPSPLGAHPISAPEFPSQTRGQSRHVSMPPPASPAMVTPPLMVTPPEQEPASRYEAPSSCLAALNASGGVYGSNLDVRTGSIIDIRTGSATQLDPRSVSSIDVQSARTGASSVRTGGSQGPLAPRHIPRKLVMPTPLAQTMPAPLPMMQSYSHSSHGHESYSPSSNHGHGSSHGHGGGPAAPPYLPRGAAPPAPDGAPAVRFAQAAVQPVPLPIPPTRGRTQPGLKKAATITRYDEASRRNLLKKKNVPAPSERARSVSPVKEKSGGFSAAIFGFGFGDGGGKEKKVVRRAQSVAVRDVPIADVRRSAAMKVGKGEKPKPKRLLSKRR